MSAIEVFDRACEIYAQRPALGERCWVLEGPPDGKVLHFLPEFHTVTYETVWRRTVEVATGLVRDPRTALKAGEVAGIYGFGSIDYVIADMACLYAGVASAVLQMGMAVEDLTHITREAGLASIICSREGLPAILAAMPACPSVRSVVVMDFHPEVAQEKAQVEAARAGRALPLPTLDDLAATGRAAATLAPFIPEPGSDLLATLMYTSGSTGFPKGAMITQRIWRSHWTLASLGQFAQFPNICINFYPLSHAMGRNAVLRTFLLGGVMNFTLKSDMSTLFEDIRLVRPTCLNLVPRISEMIHQAYRAEVQRRVKAGSAPAEAQAEAAAAMRATYLGDRLTAAVIGSAPTAPEVASFLAGCFEIPVYEGFGSTEAGVLSIDGEIARPLVSAYKLMDVPELGYRLTDQPFPRGELVVKTGQSIPGFFKNAAATQALYDEDGFLRTGDIVEERAPDQVVWVDRKNNVVKLAQGEYVTLWRLESTLSAGSPLIDQVYLYANSRRAYLLAVVVPEWSAVNERLRAQGVDSTPAKVRQLLRVEINRVAAAAQLRSYEAPRDFLIEDERWTRENGYLTGINKPARPQLKRKYGDRLEALYESLEAQQQQELEALSLGGDAPLAFKVQKAVEAVLGIPDLDLASASFKDLGGDSMSALTLATLLEEICGMPVPAAVILNPASPLQALVSCLEAQRGLEASGLPTFSAVHGKHPDAIRAVDLRLSHFLSPEELREADALAAHPLPAQVATVLLTGASGYLGHILCLEWLESMAKVGGRVRAIVRAPDDAAASARLRAVYRSGDADLERRFTAVASHLEVLAGDLAAPSLGLASEAYERLADEVDLIVHPGALVNHRFSYEQLFAPNVLGTAQLIRLALHRRRKRFDYVSTIGVLEGALGPGKAQELAGVDALATAWPVNGGYAHGYATTKWASEVLLNELHDRFGAPVRVFRPSMILPHRQYRGQINVPDMLTRLLASLIFTGIAPRSFYAPGLGPKAHYDGLPVDFIASAMVAMSSAGQAGHETFQVSNANWEDGISLDTLVDWVQSAGYPLERMPDYDAWFKTFNAKLEGLPPAQRQHSSLAILAPWARPSSDWGGDRVDATQFRERVRDLRPEGESDIPHLTEAFIHKYLADMRALGILQP